MCFGEDFVVDQWLVVARLKDLFIGCFDIDVCELVRRPDSNSNINQLNFKKLITNTLIMYTQLYTQLLSFENQLITKYLNQLNDDAAIILDSIISARMF